MRFHVQVASQRRFQTVIFGGLLNLAGELFEELGDLPGEFGSLIHDAGDGGGHQS